MTRKPLSQERKIGAQVKKPDLTLTELKAEIDAGNGQLKRDIKLNRKGDCIRLIIKCERKDLPERWAMSMLHRRSCRQRSNC
jgi:hypothetical protein